MKHFVRVSYQDHLSSLDTSSNCSHLLEQLVFDEIDADYDVASLACFLTNFRVRTVRLRPRPGLSNVVPVSLNFLTIFQTVVRFIFNLFAIDELLSPCLWNLITMFLSTAII